ncbi:MAG TPA: hypothetical protein VIV40_13695 [Kofleriaceae bacterium]
MAVRSTAVLALSTGADRVVLSSGHRGVVGKSHSCAPSLRGLRVATAPGMQPLTAFACESPPFQRRRRKRPSRSPAARMLFVLTLLALFIAGLVVGPRSSHGCLGDQGHIAKHGGR